MVIEHGQVQVVEVKLLLSCPEPLLQLAAAHHSVESIHIIGEEFSASCRYSQITELLNSRVECEVWR